MKNRRGFLRWAFASAVSATMVLTPAASVSDISTERNYITEEQLSRRFAHPVLASDSTEPVAMQLGLAMDTSGSMSDEEYALQLRATAHALNSEQVRSVIKYRGSIALFVVDFGNSSRVRIPWVDIRAEDLNDYPYYNIGYQGRYGEAAELSDSPDVLDRIVQEILTLPRVERGGTNIWAAMQVSIDMFDHAPWMPMEGRVLDVFGDGAPHNQRLTDLKRQELADRGVTINGFAIVNETSYLETSYKTNVVTQDFQQGSCFSYQFNEAASREWCINTLPGRVWAVARNMRYAGNDFGSIMSFHDEVTIGMRQKISVELAGIDGYRRVLASLGLEPDFPLPIPVNAAAPG